MMKYCRVLLAIFLFQFSVAAQPLDSSIHTILFLGNSITYAGNYITDMETCVVLWHPEQKITFINLGLPSETVSGLSEPGHAGGQFPRPDLHERLHRILAQVKPDLVFASYGMNDGIYLPFDTGRFSKYQKGMIWLHDTLMKTGARVIMVTPPVYDERRGGALGYANTLDKYADWLLTRKKVHWEVADVYYPMKHYLKAHRKTDAAFGMDGFALAEDGVHPGAAGHWLIARQLLAYLREFRGLDYGSIDAVAKDHLHGTDILRLLSERQQFMKDAWLTGTGHTRPGMNTGLPMPEAQAHAEQIGEKIQALVDK